MPPGAARPARRRTAGRVFLVVFLSVAIGAHLYLAHRLALAPAWPAGVRTALLAALGVGFVALLTQAFVRRRVGRAVGALAWTAYTWLGLAFLLLVASFASDLALALLGAAAPAGMADGEGIARARALGVGVVGVSVSALAMRRGLSAPELRRVEVALARWPRALDGFRIVQLSDVHLGPLLDRRFAASLAARVNALAPDLVVVTGDLVDGGVRRIGAEVEPLGALRARHGVFFVTGNHDYYSGADDWVARMKGLGWRALRNERVAIEIGGAAFDLAGVDDHHGALVEPGGGEDLARALDGRDPERPVVLLAHDPATFRRAARRDVDLQLSGHTHGGQIWPFRWAVRLTVPWVEGLHRVGRSALYVSRGTGFWGPPMRLGAPAEITELVLRADPAKIPGGSDPPGRAVPPGRAPDA
ncbi:MAG TPA: metallophosphoesterase [Myxococcota bacterium]|nr:metallophosphoesterase [Myxococcota bacterium]